MKNPIAAVKSLFGKSSLSEQNTSGCPDKFAAEHERLKKEAALKVYYEEIKKSVKEQNWGYTFNEPTAPKRELYPYEKWETYWPKLTLKPSFMAALSEMMEKSKFGPYTLVFPKFIEEMEEAKELLATCKLMGIEVSYGVVNNELGYAFNKKLDYTLKPGYLAGTNAIYPTAIGVYDNSGIQLPNFTPTIMNSYFQSKEYADLQRAYMIKCAEVYNESKFAEQLNGL